MDVDIFQSVRRDGNTVIPLLGELSNINITNEVGQNLLHMAAAYQNLDAAAELIRLGINVNAQDSSGQTPLHYAAAHQDTDVADVILLNGGDFGIVDEHGNTPLWTAVFNARGKYAVVESLLRSGASQVANRINKNGRSPIDFAKQIADSHLVKLIAE